MEPKLKNEAICLCIPLFQSFYLIGPVDVHDKQIEQWNVTPPLLYLWSQQDWTAKHKAIDVKLWQCFQASQRVAFGKNSDWRACPCSLGIQERGMVKGSMKKEWMIYRGERK